MPTTFNECSLVVVSQLNLEPETAMLDRGLQTLGTSVVKRLGADDYAHVRKLDEQDAAVAKCAVEGGSALSCRIR